MAKSRTSCFQAEVREVFIGTKGTECGNFPPHFGIISQYYLK